MISVACNLAENSLISAKPTLQWYTEEEIEAGNGKKEQQRTN